MQERAKWFEDQLERAKREKGYVIPPTPATFATPAHVLQKSLNPAAVRGTFTTSAPKNPIDLDRDFLNKYFGELPTKILELLQCLISNVPECKELALQFLQERILNFKNPAAQDLVTKLRIVIPPNHKDLAQITTVLQQLEGLIQRDNTVNTHTQIIEGLLREASKKLAQAAVNQSANVSGVTPEYQILSNIRQFLLPRPNAQFKWDKILLPEFPREFHDQLSKAMVNAMDFPQEPERKKADLLKLLTQEDDRVFKRSAPAAVNGK